MSTALAGRAFAVVALAAVVAGCGTARANDDEPTAPSSWVLDRPITFATTTTMAPLPQEPAVRLPPPPVAAPPAPAIPVMPAPASTAATSTPGRTACRKVAHLGDSTSVGMTLPAVVADPAARLDAQYARVGVATSRLEISGGRSIVERLAKQENGFEVATRLRGEGFSGCWVVNLGLCDAANVARGARVTRIQRIDRMMSVIGAEPVVWVDVGTKVTSGFWSDRHMQQWNHDLTVALARYPNARIYRVTAQTQPSWFASDGIHFTAAGYAARAALLSDALAATFPG